MTNNKTVMQLALDSLIESARLLGATQEKKSLGIYTQKDSMFERAYYELIEAKKQTILDSIVQPAKSFDSTPKLKVGDSSFESWYGEYCCAHKSGKQRARDAYSAGMGDPLVTYAQPLEQANDKLLQIIAAAYQIAGACDMPVHILDVLANPKQATQEQIGAMLPFVPPENPFFKMNFEEITPGIEVGYDMWGGVDIRLGGEFVYVHINYDYRYTHNAARKALADDIVELLMIGKVDRVKSPSLAFDAIAQPVPPTEPVAYAVYWGIGEMKKNSVHFERKTAEDVAAQIKSITEVRPLFAIAQPVEQAIGQNFCPRCSKRLGGTDDIHTCTPVVQS